MLEVEGLRKAFGPIVAVEALSLRIEQGECYALLGPNGAGKTTTVNLLSGLLPPDAGRIRIAGLDPAREMNRVKARIGVIPQEIALYDELSARQNLHFWARLYGLSPGEARQRSEAVLQRIGLSDRADHLVQTFSGGMKRRVNIAAAILHRPDLLFMDEPTVGIDPHSRHHIYELIAELHREGMTILYTTHYMEEAERLCSRIGIVDRGKLIAEGSLTELRAQVQDQALIRVETRGLDERAAQHLHGHFGARIACAGQGISLKPLSVSRDLTELVQQCAACQVDILHLDVREADLEAVFLELTGRALRD
jgi:ABC-2 type transport system ATP-binding protein